MLFSNSFLLSTRRNIVCSKSSTKSQLPAGTQNTVLFMVGFSAETGSDCFPVVCSHLRCVRKLVSSCAGETRHRWFGLFALLQETWLPCGGLVLAFSPASSCKCRGCGGVCAESHCKTAPKGCAQSNMEHWGEEGHRV